MKFLSGRYGVAAIGVAAFSVAAVAPALATDFVQDQAGMFSAATVAALNERISSFNASTGKAIVVVTTPSLGGAALQTAAGNAFSQQAVNGVLIFIARGDRRDIIVPDRAAVQSGGFTPDVLREIRAAMEEQFRADNYDAGVTGAVSALLGIYRTHFSGARQPQSGLAGVPVQGRAISQGVHISMFWWIIIIVGGFLILRSILRAASAPRYSGTGTPPPGAPPGGPGYGGGGYGFGGGGGSFWSGLLGGLGGAWLGNELFRGGGGAAEAGQIGPDSSGTDSTGFQSDAGQADMGGASSGDWSGGGFGGDFGGGGDGGGGGGDSGGGW
jgi:uncharacterized membrane protein YgcG